MSCLCAPRTHHRYLYPWQHDRDSYDFLGESTGARAQNPLRLAACLKQTKRLPSSQLCQVVAMDTNKTLE